MMRETKRALKKFEAALKASKRETHHRNDFSHVRHDNVVDWAESVRYLPDGSKFSLSQRPYLKAIFASQHKEINIVKGRQTEITENALNWLLYHLTENPNTVGLYLTDRQEHVKVFSERLQKRVIAKSPYLKHLVKGMKHNIEQQAFTNGSVLYMYSGWGCFEAARSVPADFVVVDEMQSVEVSHITVVKESMAHSRFKKMIKIGTGSQEGDAWYREFHLGSIQNWNKVALRWDVVKESPVEDGPVSYWIPQSIVPTITAEDLDKKRLTYPAQQFTTEVVGWFYRGMRNPLLEDDIRACMDKTIDFRGYRDVDHTKGLVFAGFDWGGGTQAHTVAWIMQALDNDIPRFQTLYVTKLDDPSTEKQADQAIELIEKYQVDQVVMDAGGGPRQVEKLSKHFAERVYTCHYLASPANPFQEVRDENRLNVDRTWIIESIIDLIKRPHIAENPPIPIPRLIIPGFYDRLPLVNWVIGDFTCIEAETTNAQGMSRTIYTHPDQTNDDALHALCYAYLAWLLKKNSNARWIRLG